MAELKEIQGLMQANTAEDTALVEHAFLFAKNAHKDHKRLSGEPYFLHLTETAKILAEYGMGAITISAGLLHDSIEDVAVTPEQIEKEFGKEILFLVEGVTKLGKLRYQGSDRHNESLRKLFVAMSQDIRVLMIKLADRLHNMRTLKHVPKEKQKRIAGETLEIYAPIAYRLGIRKLSRELEDLSFPYVYPEEYETIHASTKERYEENLRNLEKFLKSVKKVLAKENIPIVKTEFRVKGLYSLYKKLQEKKNIEEVYDVLALRIIVPTINECYRVLGAVHGTWRPLPGRIKDYIAFPKPNGYQALHTTVFTGDGNIVEVQIKTEAMYQHSEYGIASHISYKAGERRGKIPEHLSWVQELLPKGGSIKEKTISNAKISAPEFQDVPHWIQELVEYQKTADDHGIFRDDLRSDFFQHRIFAFSPKGDVVDLPLECSPVDFAYSIHSDIGDHMVGAKVNGKLVALDSRLRNGDIVDIMTKKSAKPSAKWLEYATTTMAKKHIRAALQKLNRK